jgi:nucleotide-binding universal stress UspA family protein
VFTYLQDVTQEECEQALARAGLLSHVRAADGSWRILEGETLEESLYAVPHDSLVVVGAAGRRLMTELIFGSTLETVQATLPNPLIVVGPNCRRAADLTPPASA